jgi:hypothetical protein
VVTQDRLFLYEQTPVEITDINDVRNGILLRSDLHRAYGVGDIALLKVCQEIDI